MSLSGHLCAIVGHKPNRSHAWHDGLDWRAPCRRCSKPMIRCVHQGWRLFRSADNLPDRHPRDEYHERRERDSAEIENRLKELHRDMAAARHAEAQPEDR